MRISAATRSRYWQAWALLALGLAACSAPTPAPHTPTLTPSIRTTPPPRPSATITRVASPTPLPSTSPAPTETPAVGAIAPAVTTTPPPSPTTANTPRLLFIKQFSVSPSEIRPGGSVTLTWEASGEQAVIYQLDPLGRLSEPHFDVPLSGALTLTTSELLRNQVSFALFATLGSATVQAGVTASIVCPDVWFFPDPPASCPGSPPHPTVMQAEHFEHGLMLWTQWNDFIYILYADGLSPAWEARPNAWFPPMPEDDPSLIPPDGLYQPVRGFGVAWRDEQATPGFRVRDRLGWATDVEFGVSDASFQCDSAPKYVTCYISGPGGVVYVLKPERSGWSIWEGPP